MKKFIYTFFGFTDSSNAYKLAKQYTNSNEKITAEIVSVTERPDLALTYGVESDTAVGIVVQAEKRYKVLSTNDLYTYDTTTYETIDITEQKLTNAILDTTISKKPKIYFLTGHDEYTLSNDLETISVYIENEVNDVKELNLLTTEFPEDCNTLVIVGPIKDFETFETDAIINYINNGGNILWLGDPSTQETNTPNIQKILDLYGINISKGALIETDSKKMVVNNPYITIPEVEYHEITKDIYSSKGVVFPTSGVLNIKSEEELENLDVSIKTFINSTDTAFYREDFSVNSVKKNENDIEGEFAIAAEAIKKVGDNESKLVIYANAVFATDTQIQIQNSYMYAVGLYNNKDLVLNSIAYLTNREDTIRIRKDTGTVTYTATQMQDNIIKTIIFIFPIIIIIVGIVVWQIRRRKK